jgi:hypothetical protein
LFQKSHTLAGIIIAGFLPNLIVGVYFYIKGIKKRGLTYRVNEVRIPIVKGGEASGLTILHNDKEMAGDITAAHIAIWNQGRESIRPGNMLRTLVIETENFIPILKVNVCKMTRDVVNISLDESKCQQGQLSVSWDILETNDGGIVQVIYAGSPDTMISAYATVEGQKKIIDFAYLRHVQPHIKPQIYFAMFMMSSILFLSLWPFQNSTTVPLWRRVTGVLGFIGYFISIFQSLSILRRQKPPFEF